jgi:hypothetical protein
MLKSIAISVAILFSGLHAGKIIHLRLKKNKGEKDTI